MEKKSLVYCLVLVLGTVFTTTGQIRLNANTKVEKGVQESFLLKKAGKSGNHGLVVIANSKNKMLNQPVVKPPGTYEPGYDEASIVYRMDVKAIRKLIAPIIFAKAKDDDESLMIDYYFTPDGTLKEVTFTTNDATSLSVEDFEKMEKLLLANVRITLKRKEVNPFKGVPFVKLYDSFSVSDLRKL